jgi:hypothetical protein
MDTLLVIIHLLHCPSAVFVNASDGEPPASCVCSHTSAYCHDKRVETFYLLLREVVPDMNIKVATFCKQRNGASHPTIWLPHRVIFLEDMFVLIELDRHNTFKQGTDCYFQKELHMWVDMHCAEMTGEWSNLTQVPLHPGDTMYTLPSSTLTTIVR